MGTLHEEIAFFSDLYPKFRKAVQNALDSEMNTLREAVVAETPSQSGQLKRSWRVNRTRGVSVIASGSLHNPIGYAQAIELGIDPKQHPHHPWVGAIANKTTDGVVFSKGRIWSKKAVGGTMMQVFTPSYTQKLSRRLADVMITVFK